MTSSETAGVVVGRHVEGGGDDLAADGALHVGDLLGALVHEQAEEVHLGVVGGDGLADALEHRGLAGLGGTHDQATLALADGSHEVDGTTGDGVLPVLHDQALVGVDGREVAEARTVAHLLEGTAVDRVDAMQRRILVARARRRERADDLVAHAQAILANELLVHEGVALARHVVARAQEAVALVLDLEHAGDGTEALPSAAAS